MSNRYTDIDLKFIPNPITRAIKNLDEKTSIIRALTHLLFTRQGEKLYDSQFGVGIQDQLFESNDFIRQDVLKTFITTQINNYEPRVNLISVNLESDVYNLTVTIEFSLKSNPAEVLTLEKTIRRIR